MSCGSAPLAKPDKSGQDMEHLDFKVIVEPKDGQSFTVILVASSRQEKSAWTSDISQACVRSPVTHCHRVISLSLHGFGDCRYILVTCMP